jgi:hypothetical protein
MYPFAVFEAEFMIYPPFATALVVSTVEVAVMVGEVLVSPAAAVNTPPPVIAVWVFPSTLHVTV